MLISYKLVEGTSKVVGKGASPRRSSRRASRRASITEDAIAESVSKLAGIEGKRLSRTSSLMDLGLDSLSLNELAADLTTKTGGEVEISATTFFKRPR